MLFNYLILLNKITNHIFVILIRYKKVKKYHILDKQQIKYKFKYR